MPVTSRPITGKRGRTLVGNLIIHMTDYSLEFYADDLPNRTFESIGPDGESYDEGDTGFRGCNIRIKGRVNANQMPHDPVPNINEGAKLTNVQCLLDKKRNPGYVFDEIRVLTVAIAQSAEGWATIEFSAKNNGSYTKAR